MQDDDFGSFDDAYVTARWWLDRQDPERAAALLGRADSVRTSQEEHQALAAELETRGLVCLYQDGQTWVCTPEDAEQLQAEAGAQGDQAPVLAVTGELDDPRRPARRGPGPVPGRSRSTR